MNDLQLGELLMQLTEHVDVEGQRLLSQLATALADRLEPIDLDDTPQVPEAVRSMSPRGIPARVLD